MKRICDVDCGLVDVEMVVGRPKVEDVSSFFAFACVTAEHVFFEVDRKCTTASAAVVDWTWSSQFPAARFERVQQSEVLEYLLEGDLLSQEAKIDGPARGTLIDRGRLLI